MLRALFSVPGVVADYTFGTVIVFVQLTLKRRIADQGIRHS
jgi:hypothetical protein